MGKLTDRRIVLLLVGSLAFLAGWVSGKEAAVSEKTVIHAVAWTPQEDATEGQFQDFQQATVELIDQMPGLRRAWVGKLRKPLVHGDMTRTYGLVFEFDDLQSREAYSSHPSRAPWAEVWSRLRVPGSTNFDVIGE